MAARIMALRRVARIPLLLFLSCTLLHPSLCWTVRPIRLTTRSRLQSSQQEQLVLEAAANFTLQRNPNLGRKSLGVDYGLMRTGIAVSVGYRPTPLAILPPEHLTIKIIQYARSQAVEQIVLGWPIFQNGTVAPQAELTLEFGKSLQASIYRTLGDIPVLLCDERYTSQAAEARRTANGRHGKAFASSLDAEAACILLEAYYDGDSAQQVQAIVLENKEDCLREFRQRQQEQQTVLSIQSSRPSRQERIQAALEQVDTGVTSQNTKKKKKKRRKKR